MRLKRLQRLFASDRLATILGRLTGAYIRLVYNTSRVVVLPDDAFARARTNHPAIFAFWHGMAMAAPMAKPVDLATDAMIARNQAASIVAIGAEAQGLSTIRASGAGDPRAAGRKGGATGFRQALRALKNGHSILMTADVPKVAQVAGRGVVLIARHSGRPIIPVAYASRWALRFNNWDHMAIELPFSRAAIVHGAPIFVATDADDAAVDVCRRQLSAELDRVMARAFEEVGRGDCFKPGPRDDA